MLGRVFFTKYLDPNNLVVDVYINKSLIQNDLIDLGEAINVMTKDTMIKLRLQGFLINTPIILQLAYRLIVNHEVVLEDVMVSIYSWEYPIHFIVLQTTFKLN